MFDVVLVTAALSCSLVSGLLLGFAIVALPGIGDLDDRAFLRSFQVMDRVIQDRQPLFMLLWAGSVLAVIGALVLGAAELEGGALALLVAAAILYLGGVQVPTVVVNIPLNDAVQTLDVARADDATVGAARERFETRWNRWNAIRSAAGCAASLLLLLLLLAR